MVESWTYHTSRVSSRLMGASEIADFLASEGAWQDVGVASLSPHAPPSDQGMSLGPPPTVCQTRLGGTAQRDSSGHSTLARAGARGNSLAMRPQTHLETAPM